MFRNREFRTFFISLSVIAIGTISIAASLSREAFIMAVVSSLLFIAVTVLFTRWRYSEIKKLSGYLRQISSGNYTLDVRDNFEGELSILKSEIYKVTRKLSEQGAHLRTDKIELTKGLSDISHQLKTPLTSMLVMVDLLSDADLPEAERKEFTGNIRQQLKRIEWLVSSLLKLSKIDAGTVSFKKDRILVKDLVNKALEAVLVPIDIKEQHINIQGGGTMGFEGDMNWTAEALINLLKNAVEHTDEQGKITILWDENVLYTEIRVADHGEGIAREDLPYIFKRFYKGKNASEDSVGIGLAMAYSIVTNQGGDLQVKSDLGKGTEFLLKFYKQV
ncbi:sensor histidine kinase [Salipaludibacillus aurantiacus]|uniref:histidine kinase n=1 Tax=Salipaludibacillus aurantiacus TaxID=1601833 RepID=A0A1H9Q6I1_9BACI|nr:HAMP domain-containing sensor histidine kinase [Salipaludibacillus aurantiacus]SER56060.1 Signal transduction histidine kinase [Salipaludibacillus aurantiacus]